ncbi:hypothetical protein [Flavobacterium anhuiense]|uniref:hypothetical protein n=1 Tax=Flavobacterium anhuiense TaxID=459526 RepID=UPI0011829760|nr:hypothetical protein [Flavobacterium anhuiense]
MLDAVRRKRRTVIDGYQDIFDMQRDVLYLSDLISEIASIYAKDPKRFSEIKEFLKSEFGNPDKKAAILVFNDSDEKVKHYLEVVKKSNQPDVEYLVHSEVGIGQSKISTALLFKEAIGEEGRLITGESGNGKSLIIKSWAMAMINKDIVPVILEAKYCASGLSAAIEKLAADYGFDSAMSFIDACRALGKKILLGLDGLNECSVEGAERIVAEIRELSNKHEILFLISTQQATESLLSLDAKTIQVYRPDARLKVDIAAKYSNSVGKLKPVLDMVTTAMEARMVGEIGIFGIERISRYRLFELYVRRKLGSLGKEGIFLLAAFAKKMSQEISFSISLSQAENIMREYRIEVAVLEGCLSSKIIVNNFARISFSHEMLLMFFTAESIARFYEDPQMVIEEFNAPKNDEKRLLILGSIEDNVLKEKILEDISDIDLLILIMNGEAGEFSRCWAADKLKVILLKMRNEISSIQFVLEGGSHPEVLIKRGSVPEWRNDELAFVEIVIYEIFNGRLLEEMFSIVFAMDSHLEVIFNKMKDEAAQKKISLRSGSFQAVYSPFQGKSVAVTGLSWFFSCLGSGFMSMKSEKNFSADAIRQLSRKGKTKTGQFYLLLVLCRFNESAKALYGMILHCLSNHWLYWPRTLKYEIVEAVPFCHSNENERQCLIEAVEKAKSETGAADPFLSSNLFEALNALGAFESNSENYEQIVISDMRDALANQDSKESWRQASYMFNAQFDHPYCSAFTNVIENLDEAEQKAFYLMALKHEEEYDLFLSPLISTAEKILGEQCCSELSKIFEKSVLEATMSQERMKNHIVACIILAKHKFDFVSLIDRRSTVGEKFLSAFTEIFYWVNRKDLDNKGIMEKCAPAIKVLFENYSPYLVDSLQVFNDGLMHLNFREYFDESINRLESFISEHILYACRICLQTKDAFPVSKFKDDTASIYRYATDQIGLYGNSKDLTVLKAIVNDASLGRAAVGAIKNIEMRSS